MSAPMKQIRRPDGDAGRRRFDRRERRMIIDGIIRQKNLLPPAPPHVQGRKIIESPRRSDSREQPVVFPIPEPMRFSRRSFFLVS
jgi:hypothetical protein